MNNQPIGFLDSGVGGLTVVKESLKQLPNETVYYVGDTKRCPYGSRPVEEVREFTWKMVEFLVKKGVKMIVIACNTATAVTLEEIKKTLKIPVIGVIIPGSRAALRVTQTQRIGVIGTEGTIHSGQYPKAILSKYKNANVFGLACPKFVPLVESGEYRSEKAREVVEETLKEMTEHNIDTLVMGCTHYPLLKPLIQDAMVESVTLVNPGSETVSEASMLLDYYEIPAEQNTDQMQHRFYTTGEVETFREISSSWLPLDDIHIEHIDLG